MFERSGRETAEEGLGYGEPEEGSRSAENALVALKSTVYDVEDDFFVGELAFAEAVDEGTELKRSQDVDGALADEEDDAD